MRVGFTGAHRVGKSSLIEAVAAALPDHDVIDEPYRMLEDDGHEFGDPPTRDDFEVQLRTSLELVRGRGRNVLFDRTPVDFVAYLHALDDDDELDLDGIREAMATLDLLVYVPIEEPDRIVVSASEDRRLRRRVDERIRQLVIDDGLELGIPILEVSGDTPSRLAQVLRAATA